MNPTAFINRHIGPKKADITLMLDQLNVNTLDDLIDHIIPHDIRLKKKLSLDNPLSEQEYLTYIHKLSEQNNVFKSYIGLGYHPTNLPAVIQRNILENPGWYTAYTPYQAEISQGRLEALLNFQTMIVDLTGMEIANASLLDESTAAAEAMSLLYAVRDREQKKEGINKFFVSDAILPQTLSVLKTRAKPIGIELIVANENDFNFTSDVFGAIIQYPGKHGKINNIKSFIINAKKHHIKVAVAADILSLVLLESPGQFGADVVVGTTQRFGIPMGFGGPHAAYFATLEAYKRDIPGRIIGVTKDVNNNPALRMALQTREQHIKRARATSNICTAQVLLAVMAGMYSVYHGPEGLQHIAKTIHQSAVTLSFTLTQLGFKQLNTSFFDTLKIEVNAQQIKTIAEAQQINFYYPDKNHVVIALNETTTLKHLNTIANVFAKSIKKEITIDCLNTETIIYSPLKRKTTFLKDAVFNTHHSETEMMRYIKSLERKDLSLNHTMISLGSCTMKLNAAAQMLPLSWHNWGNMHPFAPQNQTKGYLHILRELEDQLTEITGFAATSLQPNSGAQGEFAGLMIIKAYHEAKNESHRNICLIPDSAHGTNPASAVMAGFKVVVTKSTPKGDIDINDLREKATLHKDHLAALMITYPSTHGVYESKIKEITHIIHAFGGQVYMDGANMNAQVGLTNPKVIGADVCHLNLHKTFAIPHGGGGPGVGPICVAKQLEPFLPGNPIYNVGGNKAITAISSAPFGSALVCLISYAYIKLLGEKGLTTSTKIAMLNANYIKSRLQDHFTILYSGEHGYVAHEMIVDCRIFKTKGIEVSDIAKRLMDYGFHAPTVSFPVAGTLMIEPTESESKHELDRFCDAMISIKQEIDAIGDNKENNLLKNAPHTLEMLTASNWEFPYSRETAAFPLDYVRHNKFWPSVRRVDDAYGDRNLICTCTPIEAYEEA